MKQDEHKDNKTVHFSAEFSEFCITCRITSHFHLANLRVAKISCDKWYARHAVFGTKSGDESVSCVVRGITDSQHFVIDLFDPRIVVRQSCQFLNNLNAHFKMAPIYRLGLHQFIFFFRQSESKI